MRILLTGATGFVGMYLIVLMQILILGPIACAGVLFNKELPKNSNYYLNNVFVAVKRQDL